MLPANECLEPDDRPVGDLHGGLVVHDQLVAVERAAQVGLELEAIERGVVERRLVPAHARLAVLLREVHRHVGVADQLVGSVAGPVQRHTRARGDHEALACELERQREAVDDARGVLGDLVDRGLVLQQDRELVAAEPSHGVAGSYRAEQALTDRGQQLVADRVAEAVVDGLEAVEVEDDHADRAAVAGLPGKSVLEPVGEQRPVGELGQRVMERAVPKLALETVAFGDVLDRGEHRGPALELEAVRGDRDLDDATVLQDVPPGDRAGVEILHGGDLLDERREVVGRPNVGDPHREELAACVPVVRDRGGVHLEEAVVLHVEHPHRLGILEEQLAESRLLFA